MLNYQILRSILSENWFISESEAQKLTPLLMGLLTPNMEFEPITDQSRSSLAYAVPVSGGGSSVIKNIGVVTIRGALTKYDTMCAVGMQSYGDMIKVMDANDSIDAIVLDVDSPGGSVHGTFELSDVIKSVGKPIVCFANDMLASAAYWIGCSCKEIIANNATATIGSIGVMTSLQDMREYYSRQGIKTLEIYAPQSTNKNKDYRDVENGDYSGIKARLSVLADRFIDVVKSNRPSVLADQLTGDTYFAQDVVGSLIDSIGSFESTLSRAADLADFKEVSPINNHNTMSKKLYPTMASAVGVESFESPDGAIALTAEQAVIVEQVIASSVATKTTNDTLQSQLATAKADTQTANDNLSKANATITALNDRISAGPGAAPAFVAPVVDPNPNSDAKADMSFFNVLAECEKYV